MAKTAFDAQRENLWLLDPDTIVIVGVDTKDGLEHPLVNHRVLKLKKEGFDESLVKSIMEHGVLEPVVVRKNGAATEVVLGRNRTLATREANRRRKDLGMEPILVRSVQRKDNELHKLTGAIEAENNVRKNDDPLTKARNALREIDMGKSKERVALDFGVSMEVLDNLLKLPELSPKMQQAVEDGFITATAAATYGDLAHEEQEKVLDEARKLGIVITVPEARRQRKARGQVKKGNGKGAVSTRGKGIAVGVLRKVFGDEVFIEQLDPSAKAMLRWIIGEGSHRSVSGLGDALRRAGELETN
jgi:ParB family chromosome partitioning protein